MIRWSVNNLHISIFSVFLFHIDELVYKLCLSDIGLWQIRETQVSVRFQREGPYPF